MKEYIVNLLRHWLLRLTKKDKFKDHLVRQSYIQSIFLDSTIISKNLHNKVLYFDAVVNFFLPDSEMLPKFDIIVPDLLYVVIETPATASSLTKDQYFISEEESFKETQCLEQIKTFFVNANSASKLLVIPFDDPIIPETLNDTIDRLLVSKELIGEYSA